MTESQFGVTSTEPQTISHESETSSRVCRMWWLQYVFVALTMCCCCRTPPPCKLPNASVTLDFSGLDAPTQKRLRSELREEGFEYEGPTSSPRFSSKADAPRSIDDVRRIHTVVSRSANVQEVSADITLRYVVTPDPTHTALRVLVHLPDAQNGTFALYKSDIEKDNVCERKVAIEASNGVVWLDVMPGTIYVYVHYTSPKLGEKFAKFDTRDGQFISAVTSTQYGILKPLCR